MISRIMCSFGLLICIATGVQGQIVYPASNIQMLGHWMDPLADSLDFFGNQRYSGCYGWHNPADNKRYAILGGTSGTYIVDITQPSNPVLSDFVPGALDSCIWREYKTFGNYLYMGSDDDGDNRFQIVDLSSLPDSVTLVHESDTLIRRTHTLYIDGNKLYLGGVTYLDTASPMAVYSLQNPEAPALLRKLEQDYPFVEYVHDMFVRNDTIYASAGFQGLFIFTLQGDSQFVLVGQYTLYPQQGYNHSSYLTEDGKYLVFTDEVPDGLPFKVIDVSNFSNISLVQLENTSFGATPHNPYIKGNHMYMAAYQDGLHVYQITPNGNMQLSGYFDSYWQNNLTGGFGDLPFAGCWGAYPFPDNNWVVLGDMQNGLFILDVSTAVSLVSDVQKADANILFENPGTGDLLIKVLNLNIEKIEVLDMKGSLSWQARVGDDVLMVPDAAFPVSGIYFLRFKSTDGHWHSRKYMHVK
jgi:choice-of-anchor B domain-containing protein